MLLLSRHTTLTAVFVGATRGIGLATLRSFAHHIPEPRAIIIGRSAAKFASQLDSLSELNPAGSYTFLENNIELIADIDAICTTIIAKLEGQKIDLLFTSQGYISFAGRETNADGLDSSISLRYYGRVRFATQLSSHLAPQARVISVLAGGKEGHILVDDLDLERNYSIPQSMAQFSTMMTLSFDVFAKQNPDKRFLHIFPGNVATGLLGRSATGVLGVLMRWVVEPVLGFFSLKPEEAGERMVYYGTSEMYPRGSLSLDWDGEAKEVKKLVVYRQEDMEETVWEHNTRVFARALLN
ncbi:Hypothetical protein R9X50_00019900 [Acrodontium crateriforme]|uniref:NAD(P)-binding protein n=1 Tax=Acrodontium crateriforme TaxID=150365 RepID=A0AAQ3LYD3_9PEZI|nr:Hypothetical protein R9X50_00019900 [Acrodontium crateriforme]